MRQTAALLRAGTQSEAEMTSHRNRRETGHHSPPATPPRPEPAPAPLPAPAPATEPDWTAEIPPGIGAVEPDGDAPLGYGAVEPD